MQHLKCQRLVTKALIQFRKAASLSQQQINISETFVLMLQNRAKRQKSLEKRETMKDDFENLLVRFPRWRPVGSWSLWSCGTRRRTPAGPRCPWWAILNRAFLIPDILDLTHSISDGQSELWVLLTGVRRRWQHCRQGWRASPATQEWPPFNRRCTINLTN